MKIVFYSDAKAKFDRFAITDESGQPVWHGNFFENDREYDGEQSSGEMAAAKKAVWLAGKVKTALALDSVELELRVDAQWLVWANEFSPNTKTGGKARSLALLAIHHGVELTVVHVPGVDNPADTYTLKGKGFLRYSEWLDVTIAEHSPKEVDRHPAAPAPANKRPKVFNFKKTGETLKKAGYKIRKIHDKWEMGIGHFHSISVWISDDRYLDVSSWPESFAVDIPACHEVTPETTEAREAVVAVLCSSGSVAWERIPTNGCERTVRYALSSSILAPSKGKINYHVEK